MEYIVLDMEWNQPWPGSPSAKKVLPASIRGEIIQIGAVRLTEAKRVADEFQIMIAPKYYHHLNKLVSKLTGIKEARLREEGVPFPDAMARFRAWCGEEVTFLTWGFDDITILHENLRLYGMDTKWAERWYNVQMIFNAQTDGSSSQKALKTAMEIFGVEATRPAHDALGDAYHTALICSRLDMERGMREYALALEEHENGFHGSQIPGCIARKVFYGYADKNAALNAMRDAENLCPVCGEKMCGTRWFAQQRHRYMDLMECPAHGQFLIRLRLSEQSDGTIRVSRLTYEPTSEAAQSYARRAEKAEQARTGKSEKKKAPRTRRRTRRRSRAAKSAAKPAPQGREES